MDPDPTPDIVDAAAAVRASAEEADMEGRVIDVQRKADMLRLVPTPHGASALVLDGRLLTCHYQLEEHLLPLLSAAPSGADWAPNDSAES